MVIAIFPMLEDEPLEDFSINLARKWRVGQKGLDNGAVLTVFLKERRVRLEVGYGLEATLPDSIGAQIIRERIAPRFREGRYAAGLEAAVQAVFERAEGRPAPPKRRSASPSAPLIGFVAILAVVGIILIQDLLSARRFVGRHTYTAGRGGWSTPILIWPWSGGWGGGGGGSSGDGGFSGGGGDFGGGGASGDW